MKIKKLLQLSLLSVLLFCGCSEAGEETSSTSSIPVYTFDTIATDITASEASETTEAAASETIPSDTALPAEPVPEESGTVTVAFAGDTTQSDVFGEATSWRDISYPFEDVADIFKGADIAFVNLETSVSERGASEKPEGYGFRTEPKYLEVYTEAGIDIVSCANNHVRDYGMDALGDTFANLTEYGIDYVGAGKNIDEAQRLVTYEINGVTVGFTAFNMINMNSTWYANDERAGINCVDFVNSEDYLELISEYDKRCDVLLVSVHWGLEYYNTITSEQQELAHLLCDNGADIILGHHPHVLQPIESYNGNMIFYSLGNFLFYKMDDDAGKTAIFEIEVDKNGFVSGKLSPVFISYCKSVLLSPEGSENSDMYTEIIQLMQRLSEPYGVMVTDNGGIELI